MNLVGVKRESVIEQIIIENFISGEVGTKIRGLNSVT